MTIVVALKVGDGLVLGADSASTLYTENSYHNSYFNTEKLIHVRDFPVGALTFGLGSLNNRSVSSLANDLRRKINTQGDDFFLDQDKFTVEQIVDRFKRFYYDELYHAQFKDDPLPDGSNGLEDVMGFFIGGYSSGKDSAEVWQLLLTRRGCETQQIIAPEMPWNCVWDGEREAIQRVVFGYSSQVISRLTEAGMPTSDAIALLASMEPLVNGAMPIQDAIDFVRYLIETTCGYVRFSPGQMTVAKPIDIAAITKFNGLKWISRKHYYPQELNR
jgi:hypothetical protein